jgi:hypothetical protein
VRLVTAVTAVGGVNQGGAVVRIVRVVLMVLTISMLGVITVLGMDEVHASARVLAFRMVMVVMAQPGAQDRAQEEEDHPRGRRAL